MDLPIDTHPLRVLVLDDLQDSADSLAARKGGSQPLGHLPGRATFALDRTALRVHVETQTPAF
jgi:hypothetical protein